MAWFSFSKKKKDQDGQSADKATKHVDEATANSSPAVNSTEANSTEANSTEANSDADNPQPREREASHANSVAPLNSTFDKKDSDEESIDEENLSGSVERGPWDVNDENVPNYDEYLSLGAFYLPYLEGIGLQLKADRSEIPTIIGATIVYGNSSLEIEAFAAPKRAGLWDDIRTELLQSHSNAHETEGFFGKELMLPVTLKNGKVVTTRMVGVDGPRWMLRGIFSGSAASESGKEYDALNKYFADIVVERGEEPLAPRDLIPMTGPLSPSQRKALDQAQSDGDHGADTNPLDKPQGPFDSDQQSQVQTVLSRGPMFSELR